MVLKRRRGTAVLRPFFLQEPPKRVVLALIAALAAACVHAADLQAWIDTEIRDGMLQILPKVKSQASVVVRYELDAKKSGAAGRSESRQGGTKSIACCEPASLALLRLSVTPEDVYTLTLRVFVGSDLVAQDEIVYPPGRDAGN